MTKATLDDVDISAQIQAMYGIERNWQRRLWRFADFLTEADVGKTFYMEHVRKNGHVDYCRMTVPADLSVVMNGPIFSPFSE